MKAVTASALIAILATSLVATAVADDRSKVDKTSVDAKFEKLDRDHDKRVSKAEASRDDNLSAQFAAVDQNSDGFVSKAEYTAQLGSMDHGTDTDSQRPYRQQQ